MKSIRVGVVGVGNMGYNHARVYYELSRQGLVKFVGVVDIDKERVRKVAERFKVKAFTDPRDLLKLNIDAVSIAVPTSLHRDIAFFFLKNNVHILVEKPIADTLKKAKDIVEIARKNNLILLVGHIERFNPAVNTLKEIVEDRELGDIITMSAKRVGPFGQRVKDVGVIIDLAVHDIDIMSYLINKFPTEVYSRAKNIKQISKAEDYAIILLNFNDEIDGVIETNRLTPYKTRTLNVVGTKGIAQLDYINQNLIIYNDRYIKETRIQKEEPLRLELIHFINCVLGIEKPRVTGDDGLRVLKAAIAAVESYRKKTIVRIMW